MLCLAVSTLIQATRIYGNYFDKWILADFRKRQGSSGYPFAVNFFLLQQPYTVSFQRFLDNFNDTIDLLYTNNAQTFQILRFRCTLWHTSCNNDVLSNIQTRLNFIPERIFGWILNGTARITQYKLNISFL